MLCIIEIKFEEVHALSRAPIVTISQGKLQGLVFRSFSDIEYYAYRRIPYAKPPIGELRFKVRKNTVVVLR